MSLNTTQHKPLNTKQLAILHLLYRFRFGTTELLAQALNVKSKIKMNERLKLLLEQGYIGRNYNPEYRLLRKHASYYLLANGINALRQSKGRYDKAVLHNIHKDKTASEQFIDHSLRIFRAFCDLKTKHGDNLRFFTKSQLGQYDYFPEPLPDAYIRLKGDIEERQYFLEVLQSTRPFFISVRKVQKYVNYIDEGGWEDTGTKLPTIIFACDTITLKKSLDKHLTRLLDEADLEELHVLTATDITYAV